MDQEQIQQTEPPAPVLTDDWVEPTDEELIAAAVAAGGAASVDVEAEAKLAGTPPPEKVEPAPGETDEPKIAAVLRAREKAFAERQEANDYAAELKQQAQQEAAKIVADARRQAAADYDADLAARRAKFRGTPAAALRELGTTDEIVDAVAREGTAEWRAIRAAEERAERAEQKAGTVDAVKADFEAFKNQAAQQVQAQARAAVEQRFLSEHAAPEKAPYLHKRYEPEEIVAKAHALANQWNAAKIPFAHADIAEYLEHQARQRIVGAPVPPQQVSGGGSAQKVRANGSRTLSAGQGSERRASPKPIEDMSADEERDALIEVAREARRQGGG